MLIPLAEATQLSVIEGDHAGPPHLQALREWLEIFAVLPTILFHVCGSLGLLAPQSVKCFSMNGITFSIFTEFFLCFYHTSVNEPYWHHQ